MMECEFMRVDCSSCVPHKYESVSCGAIFEFLGRRMSNKQYLSLCRFVVIFAETPKAPAEFERLLELITICVAKIPVSYIL